VGQQLASPAAVKRAAFAWFGAAAVAGLALTLITSQWLFIPLGLAAIASAWFYTGGKNPYGYLGLGEVFVFVWFGLAAVLGTVFCQTAEVTLADFILAVGAGAFACALLVVNNLRDIPSDTTAHKRTLAVRLGDSKTRLLYVALVFVGFGSSVVVAAGAVLIDADAFPLWAGVGAVASLVAHVPGRAVLNGATGRDLIPVLVGTGRAQLVWAIATSVGILAS
jgi:1,4-dihydroxy-2-naphthoate octaprenyltransferase